MTVMWRRCDGGVRSTLGGGKASDYQNIWKEPKNLDLRTSEKKQCPECALQANEP